MTGTDGSNPGNPWPHGQSYGDPWPHGQSYGDSGSHPYSREVSPRPTGRSSNVARPPALSIVDGVKGGPFTVLL